MLALAQPNAQNTTKTTAVTLKPAITKRASGSASLNIPNTNMATAIAKMPVKTPTAAPKTTAAIRREEGRGFVAFSSVTREWLFMASRTFSSQVNHNNHAQITLQIMYQRPVFIMGGKKPVVNGTNGPGNGRFSPHQEPRVIIFPLYL
jgi:hypothetical protein